MPVFNNTEFLRHFVQLDARPFLSKVLETQSFSKFLERHMAPEFAPFHRVVANFLVERQKREERNASVGAAGGFGRSLRDGGEFGNIASLVNGENVRMRGDGAAPAGSGGGQGRFGVASPEGEVSSSSSPSGSLRRRRLRQRRGSTELFVVQSPRAGVQIVEELRRSRYGRSDPSEQIFRADDVHASSPPSSPSLLTVTREGGAAPAADGGQGGSANERKILRSKTTSKVPSPAPRNPSASRQRRVVNFEVPAPACRLPYTFELRRRDTISDVSRIVASFAHGAGDLT